MFCLQKCWLLLWIGWWLSGTLTEMTRIQGMLNLAEFGGTRGKPAPQNPRHLQSTVSRSRFKYHRKPSNNESYVHFQYNPHGLNVTPKATPKTGPRSWRLSPLGQSRSGTRQFAQNTPRKVTVFVCATFGVFFFGQMIGMKTL